MWVCLFVLEKVELEHFLENFLKRFSNAVEHVNWFGTIGLNLIFKYIQKCEGENFHIQKMWKKYVKIILLEH